MKELWNAFTLAADTLRQRAYDVRKNGEFGDAFSEFEKSISDACMKYHNAVFSDKNEGR